MVQPAVPSIPGGGPRPPDQAAVNRQLQQLYQYWYGRDTGVAQSILRYIQSGWTTPVDPRVQQAISTLVGRQVPATGTNAAAGMFTIPGGGNNGQPLYPPGGGGLGERTPLPANAPAAPGGGAPPPSPVVPPPGSSIASLFANAPGAPAYANPGAGIWPDQPPTATGTGYQNQGGAQAVPDPNALPVTGKGSSFFNTPPAAYSPPLGGPTGAASYGSETGPTSPAVAAGQRAGATATQPGGARPGGGSTVNPPGFTPAPGNPLTTPAGNGGPFGALDPSSAPSQAGYAQAQEGDPTALSAVLTQILGKYGIDVNRGGIFTPGLVSSLAPYLKTIMRYGGLADGGKPVIPSQVADQFASMVGGPNTFGQIQGFARNLLPGLGSMLSAPAGALANSENQVGIVNDLLGMLTAGTAPINQQYQQGINQGLLSNYVQSQLGGQTQNYIDWMRQNAAKVPGSDLLAQIIGAGR